MLLSTGLCIIKLNIKDFRMSTKACGCSIDVTTKIGLTAV